MGNITVLDILGSALLAGFLLTMVYHANVRMSETEFTSGNDLVVQENMVQLVKIIEKDFRNIGYCLTQSKIPDPTKAILEANTHNVTFLTDWDNNGNVDTVKYAIGTTGSLISTPNPRDMLLYRVVGGNSGSFNLGLTKFNLRYYDLNDDTMAIPIGDLSDIHYIRLDIQLESTHPYDTTYSYAAWRSLRLNARNVRGR